mmetsp:Transcript_31475/g.85413  ORF Transcript_31475/g.85413 Transcript_31475/m.85413 type:complete len:267 (-) Transcript_31475:69-869(-)
MGATLTAVGPDHGLPGCPCIGSAWIETWYARSKTVHWTEVFPGDEGTQCEDSALDPACDPGNPDLPWYCSFGKWCFVDGCNCNVAHEFVINPENDSFPMINGHALSVSAVTCGSDGELADFVRGETAELLAAEDIPVTCDTRPDASTGDELCKCIELPDTQGTVSANISGANYSYLADVGSSCSAWDENRHPACNGTDSPSWCSQQWCYVDPCRCQMAPKMSAYLLGGVSYQGMPLFYSYETCGQRDVYSSNESAVASQSMIGASC